MPKLKKEEIITKAKPHTIKKFELIERYVDEWARKILGFGGVNGNPGSEGVIYIDCMSNSGLYYDVDNNIVEGTALRVAKKLNEILPEYPGKHGYVLFNDISDGKINRLQEEIEKLNLTNITVCYNCGDCNDFLRSFDLRSLQSHCGTLLLYDPYQATIDWEAVTPFLNVWGEVIINHMVSDTSRGAALASKTKVIEKYQDTYQQDIANIIEIGKDKSALNNAVISIIRNQAQSSRYIASFPFFNRTNGLVYNLIYVSGNIHGIKLFKKVAWKTFGGKSSLKDTHGMQYQLHMDLDGTGRVEAETDDECYYVSDIAKDIINKFGSRADVTLNEIYQYLDAHPIFPSDGYKDEIKAELRNMGVKLPKSTSGIIQFP